MQVYRVSSKASLVPVTVLPFLVLRNWTCLQLKQPKISKSFSCSFYEVQGRIISKLWGRRGAKVIDICFLFHFICHIYPPFTRKQIVSLYFERHVRTRLGVAISEVSEPPVFHIKVGPPIKCLAQDKTSELDGLFSATSSKC